MPLSKVKRVVSLLEELLGCNNWSIVLSYLLLNKVANITATRNVNLLLEIRAHLLQIVLGELIDLSTLRFVPLSRAGPCLRTIICV